MEIEELTALDAMWDKGTNLHHALLLANRHFRKHPNAQPVLLIVTDGEPTSHLEPDGEVWFSYPPHPLTVAWSVRELDNAARLGAQTTFFRLGDDPGLARFLDQLADRVDGRVVSPELDDLGAAVVGSYLGGPRRLGGERRPHVRLVRRPRVLVRRLTSGAGENPCEERFSSNQETRTTLRAAARRPRGQLSVSARCSGLLAAVTEQVVDRGQPGGHVAHGVLHRHPDAAVQLDRLLADVPTGRAHLELGPRAASVTWAGVEDRSASTMLAQLTMLRVSSSEVYMSAARKVSAWNRLRVIPNCLRVVR